ncbi:MAG: hypothetical protein E6772_09390 [Dysgonomonas sp.]|nr:hypothetical protein [Dysgonomonas sp.]
MTTNNNQIAENNFWLLIKTSTTILNLSFDKIRHKYKEYPICIIQHIEKDEHDKYLEIRFDYELATLTCRFDKNDICDFVFLNTDDYSTMEKLVDYLSKEYSYNYMKSHWEVASSYAKIQESKESNNEICIIFYPADNKTEPMNPLK